MTIQELINIDKEYNKNDKLLILSFLFNKKKELLLVDNTEIPFLMLKKYNRMLHSDIPLQYQMGKTYFYNSELFVNRNVLIPRYETELLVDYTLKLIKENYDNKPLDVVDIGTGTGAIAIALKKENNNLHIDAIDISKRALKIAKKNAFHNNVNINYMYNNLLKHNNKKYDVIISNPPYIEDDANYVDIKTKKYEPKLALYGGNDGLYFYKEILNSVTNNLKEQNIIAFEIGFNQKEQIINLAIKLFPNAKIIAKQDFNRRDRYIFILNNFE